MNFLSSLNLSTVALLEMMPEIITTLQESTGKNFNVILNAESDLIFVSYDANQKLKATTTFPTVPVNIIARLTWLEYGTIKIEHTEILVPHFQTDTKDINVSSTDLFEQINVALLRAYQATFDGVYYYSGRLYSNAEAQQVFYLIPTPRYHEFTDSDFIRNSV